MHHLIDFLENHAIDKNFYCRAYNFAGTTEWEIHWKHKANKKKCWGLKRTIETEWCWYTAAQLPEVIAAFNISVETIESEMISNIKSMVVYSNLMLEEAKRVLGENIISDAMIEYHEFTQALISCLKQHLPLSDADQAKAKRRAPVKLHLVPND
jgi:hypothetical protein